MVDDDLNSGNMHSLLEVSNGASHVPAFLAKLWKIVDDPNTNDLICWSEMGNSFLIRNQSKFAQELLPLYYKHNNMASFVRQLNMYGFHKVVSVDQGGLRNDKDEMEFAHPFFLRGSESTLELIKRKIPAAKLDDPRGARPDTINKVLLDVRQMKGRQDTMDTKLMNVKRENEALWRELSVLRQKHAKQQQIVSKLLQFLVGMMSSQSHRIGFKRRMHMNVPLMLNDSDGLKGTKRNKNSGAELIGPVIRDVTDYDDSHSSLKKATTAASTAVSTMASNTTNTTVATLQGFNLPSTSKNAITSSADGSIEAKSMPTLMYIPGIDTPVEVVLSIPEQDDSPSALHDINNDDDNPETISGNVEMPVTPTSTGSTDQTDGVLDITSPIWEGAQSSYPSSSTAMQLRVPSPKTPILNADESSLDGPSTQMVLSTDGLRQDLDGHLDDVQAGLDNLTELLLKQDHYGIDSNTLLSLFDSDSDILSLQDVEALQDRDATDNTSSTPATAAEEDIAYNPSLYELTDDDIDE